MNDSECVDFLRWVLPQMRMRWAGFRKVRRQVCRRISDRLEELQLAGPSEYKVYLNGNPQEWKQLDPLCRITISRFYRDKSTFHFLKNVVLKRLASETGTNLLRVWCCGCASGEEPYTLSLIWHRDLKPEFPGTDIEIIATDSSEVMIDRALVGLYTKSSLKDLPDELLQAGFTFQKNHYIVNNEFRGTVRFVKQDVRENMPEGLFHVILCRYLVFTYFDHELQTELLRKFMSRLSPGGALVLGKIDRLPIIP
ncbi:MAG: hypothetical protein JSW20_10995, partial [Nitrospiraceae bacterium]